MARQASSVVNEYFQVSKLDAVEILLSDHRHRKPPHDMPVAGGVAAIRRNP
jgi:hypothetical protein